MSAQDNEDLIDYEDDIPTGQLASGAAAASGGDEGEKDKKNFAGIHSTGFRYVHAWRRLQGAMLTPIDPQRFLVEA